MATNIMQEFKNYAEFSVRVDQFFYVVNTYATNHESLKQASSTRPSGKLLEEYLEQETVAEEMRKFIFFSVVTLDNLKRTGIFSDAQDLGVGSIDPKTIPPDLSNFAFYTCFCFQWSLFENFIKLMMQKLIDAGSLPIDTAKKLKDNWLRTKKFFDVIDSGEVFGHSPFKTILPIFNSSGKPPEFDYAELNKIRELRNKFIHGVESPEILPSPPLVKQKYYEQCMWVLRQFATNVQFDTQRLLGTELAKEL
jgi:hypothetical protein